MCERVEEWAPQVPTKQKIWCFWSAKFLCCHFFVQIIGFLISRRRKRIKKRKKKEKRRNKYLCLLSIRSHLVSRVLSCWKIERCVFELSLWRLAPYKQTINNANHFWFDNLTTISIGLNWYVRTPCELWREKHSPNCGMSNADGRLCVLNLAKEYILGRQLF